ncbi:hypothetical protein IR083_01495 [Dysgonomonas sp. GY75]|uniref:hypothetical protein n=1 Tax=Dysgonomonas sp. GY75 TaxID=2780419 RepID=UPI0018848829|nr:hypothetical protein [Dysgonomonas sp. GY75]MBF0647490.1 hypothetical protein [Dysgonomonas sp. GY75]
MKKYFYIVVLLIISIGIVSCDKNIDDEIDRTKDKYYFIYEDNKKIEGIWTVSLDIDSIVLILKNNTMKEYVYEKSTKEIIDRTNHGEYRLTYYPNYSQNTYIILEKRTDSIRWSFRYTLKNSILTIYNEKSDSSIDYKKIN